MQSQGLSQKVAIVTGASRGIGAAIALELAKRGARVLITYVSPSAESTASQLVKKINGLGHGAAAIAIRADMRDRESPKKIVEACVGTFGSTIDILVNNAGTALQAALPETTHELYDAVMDLNVRGVIFLTQAVIPHLPASGGRIINIGSVASRIPASDCVYLASKAALEALARSWARELGPSGCSVNTVAPGVTETELLSGQAAENPTFASFLEGLKEQTVMQKRMGTPEDIALVVAMIAEPQSQWITGQYIAACGGVIMV